MAIITVSVSRATTEKVMGTGVSISAVIATSDPYTFRRQSIMSHGNRPASVSFSRSIQIGRGVFALSNGASYAA